LSKITCTYNSCWPRHGPLPAPHRRRQWVYIKDGADDENVLVPSAETSSERVEPSLVDEEDEEGRGDEIGDAVDAHTED
jgi:hypothetical protein